MTYQEDFVLDKKYLNLIGKTIHDKQENKNGMITGIEISDHGYYLKAFYDVIDSDCMVFFEDFKKGKLQFVVIQGMEIPKEMREKYESETIEDIKVAFGDEFTDDMIISCTNEEYKSELEKKKQAGINAISGRFGNLEKLSAEIFYDNYTTVELYKRYASGAITETEMLFGICNFLCGEVKRLKDDNLNYFIDKFNHEQAEFLVEYAARKKEADKKGEKIINEKGKIFEMLDVMMETEE